MKGFICGAFDLLHPGHIYTLRECKKACDWLVVGLHVNPKNERKNKNKPVETVFERYVRLMGCRYVDEVIPYETNEDLINLLNTCDLDIRFLGSEYRRHEDKIIGIEIVPIKYIWRKHNYSTTELRKRIQK